MYLQTSTDILGNLSFWTMLKKEFTKRNKRAIRKYHKQKSDIRIRLKKDGYYWICGYLYNILGEKVCLNENTYTENYFLALEHKVNKYGG